MTWTYVKVDHPPGFEGPNTRFFRPVMSTFGEDSILLTGSKIFTGESDEISYMNEIFQYKVGTGWISLGQLGKTYTECSPNMLATSDSILKFFKPHVSKSKTCFEILAKKSFK